MVNAMPGLQALVVVLLVLTVRGAAQVVIPTDGAPPGPRTGMIVGQVVDSSTGAPVAEAIVRLTLPKYAQDPAAPNGRVMADADGRFFFTDLPKGDYYLQATKDGYAPGTYGQRRAWGQSQLLSIGEGERPTDVRLRVWKHGAIAGTVVDESGEPIVGIAVHALVKNVVAGRAQFGNSEVILGPGAITDDRGMFRMSQLAPGTYVVLVPSTQTTLPAAWLAAQDSWLRSELFWGGVNEISQLGQPRTQQVGDLALMTLNSVAIPPPPSSEGRMAVYPTTFFPSAATASAATPITVGAGEERTDVAIALRPVPAVRVSGRLVAPNGAAPPPTTIRLTGIAMTDVVTSTAPSSAGNVGYETVTGMSDEAGRFTLLGVPPGEYVLEQANRFLSRALREGTPAYWVAQPVTVGTDDLPDLTVTLRPAVRIEGRIELRSANSAQAAPPRILGLMFETPFGEPGQVAAEVSRDAQRTFSTLVAGGRYIVRPYELSGWFVQSITLAGKDVTDRVVTLQEDATSFVVTMTDRPSKVSGTVTDARGAASDTAVVLAFPVDPKLWSGYGASPRNLKTALTSRIGAYTFDHLPPGEYHVIAVDPADADGWQDPARLEALAREAARLTVAADTSRTLDLRLKAIR
jgi:Carboxypeptidase regulatory-like domain